GTVSWRKRKYRSFEDARRFVRRLGLRNSKEWTRYVAGNLPGKARPSDIPSKPGRVYRKNGWKGLGDWLGTGFVHASRRRYRSFAAARRFAHSLRLHSESEWRLFLKGELPRRPRRPADIPADPRTRYRGTGWSSWPDWLGTVNKPRGTPYRSFAEAR